MGSTALLTSPLSVDTSRTTGHSPGCGVCVCVCVRGVGGKIHSVMVECVCVCKCGESVYIIMWKRSPIPEHVSSVCEVNFMTLYDTV